VGSQDHYTTRPVRPSPPIAISIALTIDFRYLISKLFKPMIGCDTSSLRLLNAQALCAIFTTSYLVLRTLRYRDNSGKRLHEGDDISARDPPAEDTTFLVDVHSAFNIALFPPLFFFSVLYYTDVMSTLTVLLAYGAYLWKPKTGGGMVADAGTVLLGVVALLFRQTNIFWVAVFPAGLAAVDALKVDVPSATSGNRSLTSVMQSSWSEGMIYDCSVQEAGPQGTCDVLHRLSLALTDACQTPLSSCCR
jgi:alpha-1,2-glucosyltransferase